MTLPTLDSLKGNLILYIFLPVSAYKNKQFNGKKNFDFTFNFFE